MPTLAVRKLPSSWKLQTGHGVGQSSRDFYLLAGSPDYDDYHARLQPPLEHWTHVLRFSGTERRAVITIPERLMKMSWHPPTPPVLIGDPEAIFDLPPSGPRALSIKPLTGVLAGIWGPDHQNTFVCGVFPGFAYCNIKGSWYVLPFPEGVEADLHHITGFAFDDVYFVGYAGTVLHFDGRELRALEVPTTRTLVFAELLDDERLCISGYAGVLLYGNRRGWRLVPTGTDEPILSLARFRGAIWFCTPEGLWSFDGTRAPKLVLDIPGYWVNGIGDALTFFDGEKTYLFDGKDLHELDTTI
jgi:hypothetical protein